MEQLAGYRTHPVHNFSFLAIQEGHATLAQRIAVHLQQASQPVIITIDGFVGIQWDIFQQELQTALAQQDLAVEWQSTEPCFRPAEELKQYLTSYLTNDPVFGRIFRGHLEELWQEERVKAITEKLKTARFHTIVYGYGASLLAEGNLHIYAEVPKDRGQLLAGQKAVYNVGANEHETFGLMYKRLYFVDWPMLNRIKRASMARMDIFVDATDSSQPRWVEGAAFRTALHELAQQPFRVKPWFAPGTWGGQWMKENFGLPPEQPNYAWSFELIAPENGLLLGDGERSIECAFDYLLWWETDAVLGVPVSARYGSYFPIRFDYLDTMSGTNLSCQVHPRVDYIRDEFGEPFTQDETYYIVTNKPDSRVFLGLREDTTIDDFRADAYAARDQHRAFEIEKHVNSFPSKQHDLFLIPSGTVHCSGADNLVLEISATPYIFTFKIYDYLRADLNGNLRHVHLEHAFKNIDASRTTGWVQENLIPQPVMVREGEGWQELQIGNIDKLFFAIHRLEFTDTIADETNERFVTLNLVEGEHCEIVVEGQEAVELRFAESIIIPASVARYSLHNTGSTPCKVVKAFVK